MLAASGVAFLMAPAISFAEHNEYPSCDTRHYPPAACKPNKGGAGHGSPPLQANPHSRVPPGTPVSMNASGCAPGAAVVIGLARMTSPAQIIGLTQTNADANGAYSTSAVIPANLSDGTYVMYGECRSQGSEDTTVNTTSFTVQAAESSSLRSSSGNASTGSSSSGSSASTSSDAPATTAAELPAAFTPPAGWTASPAKKAAITEAVNLRLAAMKAELPAQAADTTAAPAAVAAPADYTPWYAAAGAGALLLLGAAGWRRRTTVGNDTNSEVSA